MSQSSSNLRMLLKQKPIAVPGTFFPFGALQAQAAGFEACYVSGAALSTSLGMLDEGYVSREDAASLVRNITQVANIPVIVDCDTGLFSRQQLDKIRKQPEQNTNSVSAVSRTVRALETAGAAAMHIEDQDWDFKRCGHLDGKQVVPQEYMVRMIRAAVRARKNPDFMIIARTDAKAVEGMEGAIKRALAYVEAGADAIFPEALESIDEFQLFRAEVPDVLLVANLAEQGKTPEWIRAENLFYIGYRIVLFPATGTRAMYKTHADVLGHLRKEGRAENIVRENRILSRTYVNDFIQKHSKLRRLD